MSQKKEVDGYDFFVYFGRVLPRGVERPANIMKVSHNDFIQKDVNRISLNSKPHHFNHYTGFNVGGVMYTFSFDDEKYIIGYLSFMIHDSSSDSSFFRYIDMRTFFGYFSFLLFFFSSFFQENGW